MPFTGIANPEQLALLRKALDEYCQSASIDPRTPAHEDAVYLVMELFRGGVATAEELKAALRIKPRPPRI